MVELHWKFPAVEHVPCQLRDFRWIYRPKLWRQLLRPPAVNSQQVFQCINRTVNPCGWREAMIVELHWKLRTVWHFSVYGVNFVEFTDTNCGGSYYGPPAVNCEQVFQCINGTFSQCGWREALIVELHWKFPAVGHIPCQLRDFRWIYRPKLWRKLVGAPSVNSEQFFQCINRTVNQCGWWETLMVELHWKFRSVGHFSDYGVYFVVFLE